MSADWQRQHFCVFAIWYCEGVRALVAIVLPSLVQRERLSRCKGRSAPHVGFSCSPRQAKGGVVDVPELRMSPQWGIHVLAPAILMSVARHHLKIFLKLFISSTTLIGRKDIRCRCSRHRYGILNLWLDYSGQVLQVPLRVWHSSNNQISDDNKPTNSFLRAI